jgi:hypothetical protein
MRIIPNDCRRIVAWMGLLCAVGLHASGCSDPMMNSGIAHPGKQSSTQSGPAQPEPNQVATVADAGSPAETVQLPADQQPADQQVDPARPREFAVEGADGAWRITFDDLDLMKLLNMDPVTPDCVDKMPEWLKGLSGRMVRVRGFMKPSGVTEGIPQFLLVRSTDLCCFGPKGKVYHLIDVKLKPGLTTDYIELKPFDVEGKFKIEKIELDDGLIFLLYHIDDAAIIRS